MQTSSTKRKAPGGGEPQDSDAVDGRPTNEAEVGPAERRGSHLVATICGPEVHPGDLFHHVVLTLATTALLARLEEVFSEARADGRLTTLRRTTAEADCARQPAHPADASCVSGLPTQLVRRTALACLEARPEWRWTGCTPALIAAALQQCQGARPCLAELTITEESDGAPLDLTGLVQQQLLSLERTGEDAATAGAFGVSRVTLLGGCRLLLGPAATQGVETVRLEIVTVGGLLGACAAELGLCPPTEARTVQLGFEVALGLANTSCRDRRIVTTRLLAQLDACAHSLQSGLPRLCGDAEKLILSRWRQGDWTALEAMKALEKRAEDEFTAPTLLLGSRPEREQLALALEEARQTGRPIGPLGPGPVLRAIASTGGGLFEGSHRTPSTAAVLRARTPGAVAAEESEQLEHGPWTCVGRHGARGLERAIAASLAAEAPAGWTPGEGLVDRVAGKLARLLGVEKGTIFGKCGCVAPGHLCLLPLSLNRSANSKGGGEGEGAGAGAAGQAAASKKAKPATTSATATSRHLLRMTM